MAVTHLKGNEIHTSGDLPQHNIPDTSLVTTDLQEVNLNDYKGKKVILNIFPSIDTGVCAQSTRVFNEKMNNQPDVVTVTVSKDLPFALGRFCGAEGLENIVALSAYRNSFGQDWGVEMTDGPLKGLLARSVVVLNEQGEVIHSQLVDEITSEPDYEAALNAAK